MAKWYERGPVGSVTSRAKKIGRGISDVAGDTFRDVPVIGELAGLKSSAEIAEGKKLAALTEAQEGIGGMYGEAYGYMTPYAEIGSQQFQQFTNRMNEGRYDPGQFVYRDTYRGGPETRSIADFMGDLESDPGYQFRLEQGQKAIDRAAAAGGRFGGGRTALELQRMGQGLASQEYGQAFQRASAEREAQRMAEQQRYGRSAEDYQRAFDRYGLESRRLGDMYTREGALAQLGPEMGRYLSQMKMGEAGLLSDLALQRGATRAEATMANADQFAKLVDLAESGAKIYAAGAA